MKQLLWIAWAIGLIWIGQPPLHVYAYAYAPYTGEKPKVKPLKRRKQHNEEKRQAAEAEMLRESFRNASEFEDRKYTTPQTIQELNDALPKAYVLGPGDVVEVQVWDQPDLSGQHVIGPGGGLSLPLVGELTMEGLTRVKAAEIIREALSQYYRDPLVNFRVLEYNNNRVFVLGRVALPGMVEFKGRPTLLEALSRAGSIPVVDATTQLTKCAVIRGRDQIIWIDLKELLLSGNLSLNLHLTNNDVIFIPDGRDALIYVMGEVETPGAYRITAEMSFLDALMLAGGPTESAKKGAIALIRADENGEQRVLKIDLNDFRSGDFKYNVILKENDIIFVSRKGLAHFNYIMRMINPFAQLLLVREAFTE